MLRRTAAVAAVLGLVLVVGGAKQKKDPAFTHRLEDVWNDTAHQPTPFKRLLIIGITDDIDTRKQFENKFVSHLRGFGVDGVTSYSLVYDLTVVEDETEIVQAIEERNIDGAISVRVVPIDEKDVEAWLHKFGDVEISSDDPLSGNESHLDKDAKEPTGQDVDLEASDAWNPFPPGYAEDLLDEDSQR